tara:strand:+ start:5989 stop:6507 length:519 start_codon:yes stop_codon:yes gene_type:complete
MYTRLNNDFYDIDHITKLLSTVTWYSLPKQQIIDGPTHDTSPWPHITSGFVQVQPGYNLPPHEDNILAEHINHTSKYYSDWLLKTGNRKCAIMIPIEGDFAHTYTDLYDIELNKIDSFTLEDGPVLYQTSGGVLHGVDNREGSTRITYQLSFDQEYHVVRELITSARLYEQN